MPPVTAWHRLPEHDPALAQAASVAYTGERAYAPLAVPGTQAAIQSLPRLLGPRRVLLPALMYQEHAEAWRRAGHAVQAIPGARIDTTAFDAALDQADVLVFCQPNNPTGQCLPRSLLLDWHARLARRGGWLIVDEAYLDALADLERAALALDAEATRRPGLVVLRSLGKFFGLAGLRLGFVFAETRLLDALGTELGPWAVSGPAQWVGRRALEDLAWQRAARERSMRDALRLQALLARHRLASGGSALFRWIEGPRGARRYEPLARLGVLTRAYSALTEEAPQGLRIGLPGFEAQWTRLAAALARIDDDA
jgi:cobalamin biosynthetic protein CobC